MHFKFARLFYERKQLFKSIMPKIEISFQIRYALSNITKEIPATLIIHTIKRRPDMRHRRTWWLPYRAFLRLLNGATLIVDRLINFVFCEEDLCISEALTGVAKALGCLGFAKPIYVNTLLSYSRSQSRKIAVGGNQAESLKPVAMK